MITKAVVRDVKDIHRILEYFAQKGDLLPRSLSDIYENLRDFFVYRERADGEILGVCALHIHWEDLAEIRSLAVNENHSGKGVGTRLVKACISEAKALGVKQLFVLTYKPKFFEKIGFNVIEKGKLPHKIWGECIKCHKFPDCDEVALIMEI